MKKALIEGLRLMVLAMIPVILMGIDLGERTVSIDWFLILFSGIIAGLRFVDKWLHELGKETGNLMLEKGITRF